MNLMKTHSFILKEKIDKDKCLKFLITKKPKDKKSFEYFQKAIHFLLQKKNTEVYIDPLCIKELED